MNLKTTSKEFASPDNFGIVDPEMATVTEPRSVKSRTPRRTIGFCTASSIVIANIIGTGIFTSLGFQLADIQSGFPLLMLWIIGGIAALCGALCYGELSAALPRSGGEYHFLSQIYHPALGFMAGFVSATVGFAAPIALAAMAFGKYFVGVFGVGSPVLLSFVVVWVVTLFHLRNLQIGSAFQNLWTIVKLLLIGALIAAGFLIEPKQEITFLPQSGDTAWIFSGAFAVALVYVMYSYSGWNASSYIIGEVKKPEKNVPRSSARWNTHCHRGLRSSKRGFSRDHPARGNAGSTRRRVDRGQTYFWDRWRAGCRRGDLSRLGFRNQLNDVDWAAGQHVDGRRSLVAATAWAQESSRHSHKRGCAAVAHRECTFAHTQL